MCLVGLLITALVPADQLLCSPFSFMSVPPFLLNHLFIRRYGVFSGLSFLLYDHMMTFPLEVQYMWNAPWTSVKVGFLLHRYGNAIGQTFIMLEETGQLDQSEKFCSFYRLYCTLFFVFSAESIRILVLMRAWAIWGYRYCVAVFLITLYVLYVISVTVAMIYSNTAVKPLVYDDVSLFGVCLGPIDPYTWVMWLATLLLDSIVLALVWYNLCKLFKDSYTFYPSPLIRLLLRDAVLFYIASVFNSVFTIICWTVYRQDPRRFLHIALSTPLLSVVGQRLILNLREFQRRSFSTRDLSREVDRQMAAFCSDELVGENMGIEVGLMDVEQGGSDENDRTTKTAESRHDITEVGCSQGPIMTIW